jgi:hypothetical protein
MGCPKQALAILEVVLDLAPSQRRSRARWCEIFAELCAFLCVSLRAPYAPFVPISFHHGTVPIVARCADRHSWRVDAALSKESSFWDPGRPTATEEACPYALYTSLENYPRGTAKIRNLAPEYSKWQVPRYQMAGRLAELYSVRRITAVSSPTKGAEK